MRVLALDTATDTTTVAICDGRRVLVRRATRGDRQAARLVMVSIDECLAAATLGISDLHGVVVGTGPGSFTALRVGIVTATALADAAAIPIAGVGSLDALAAQTPGAVAVIDARRGEVFAAGPGVPLGAYRPERLAARLAAGCRIVGDGAVRYADRFAACGVTVADPDDPSHTPDAAVHARLAVFDQTPPRPLYVRAPDAAPRIAEAVP
jgi:tRNA threonylcarbamoyl adenosine modification protein YeaZ